MRNSHKIILAVLLCLPATGFALANWVTFSIDGRVSVQLPVTAEEMDLSKVSGAEKFKNIRVYNAKDANGLYQVIRMDMTNSPENQLEGESARKAYFDGVISGILRNQQGVLLERSSFPVNGGEGLEIKYKGIHQSTKRMVVKYGRSVLVDKVGYSLNFIPQDVQDSLGLSGNEQRRMFFNSIVVKSAAIPGK